MIISINKDHESLDHNLLISYSLGDGEYGAENRKSYNLLQFLGLWHRPDFGIVSTMPLPACEMCHL